MAIVRTPQQEAVVKDRGGSLLVSAAAGSGKTRVLVERLMDYIQNEGKNISDFLIITFTRAAAEELRGRIAQELAEAQKAQPHNAHLRRQSALLYETQISTIHAFCTVLMGRALDQVLEARYEDIDPQGEFAALLDILSAGRDDSRLMEIVLDVFAKIQSHPDPTAWLEGQRRAFDLEEVRDLGQTPWGALLLQEGVETARYWAGQLDVAIALAQEEEVLEKAYLPSLLTAREGLLTFAQEASQGWDEAVAVSMDFPRLKAARNVEDKERQERIKALREGAKEAAEELKKQFSQDTASHLADLTLIRPAMAGLVQLVEDFAERYEREKRQRSLLDFSDLEHQTLRLLTGPGGEPTPLARQWGFRYAEIMVDEYQDTNQVQNAIFDALSDGGRRLFMVGDVKQSIYRFRLADPTIFLEKYRAFPPHTMAKEGEPRRIVMSQNFRSRPEVLESVNDLFRAILSRQLGEMDYTPEDSLHYPGEIKPGGTGYETELHVLDFSQDPAFTEEKEKRYALEARFVARRIAQLLGEGFPVSDGKGGTRPVEPEDIAILLRSPGPVQSFYTAALEEQGVAWWAETGGDFFDTTEVSVALAFLQIIDNPRQDLPLVAVLRSPLVGFSADRLAQLRVLAKGDLYEALLAGAMEEGGEDCQAFLSLLERLRFGAGEKDSHTLLWELYQREGFLEVFASLPNGEGRRENLLAFYDLARRFEGKGHRGLFPFLLHLSRVRERGKLPVPSAPKESSGVKLTSIHRSKGLEYPVVFLCGLGRQFNYADLRKPVLFHPTLGLGPEGIDQEALVKFTTVPRTAVALTLKKELLAEEMRLLYVAMTRAKDKLVMIHTLSHGEKELSRLAGRASLPVDPWVLADCTSMGQWIALVALARPEGECLREAGGWSAPPPVSLSLGPAWQIRLHRGAVSQEVTRVQQNKEGEVAGGLSPKEALERLSWQYPFRVLAATPAKVTATQLPQGEEEPVALLPTLPSQEEGTLFHRPRFAQERLGLTPAQRGIALHTAMQTIRLSHTGSVGQVREELARLVAQDYLTRQQAEGVSPSAITGFFSSPLGREMKEAGEVFREYPFSLLVPARRFFPKLPEGEEILLQGMIDCWYRGEGGLTIVDFKTDHIPPSEVSHRGEEYRSQLEAYRYALETITGEPVTRLMLWFLHLGVGLDLMEG